MTSFDRLFPWGWVRFPSSVYAKRFPCISWALCIGCAHSRSCYKLPRVLFVSVRHMTWLDVKLGGDSAASSVLQAVLVNLRVVRPTQQRSGSSPDLGKFMHEVKYLRVFFLGLFSRSSETCPSSAFLWFRKDGQIFYQDMSRLTLQPRSNCIHSQHREKKRKKLTLLDICPKFWPFSTNCLLSFILQSFQVFLLLLLLFVIWIYGCHLRENRIFRN